MLVGALHALKCAGLLRLISQPGKTRHERTCQGLRCLGRGNALGGAAEAEPILSSRTRDYEGNLVERVGEINADLVIGAWLQEGVAEVTDLISPRLHFKRGSDQPRSSKKGHVHATQRRVGCLPAAHA